MRLGIVGTGAIGCLLGGILREGGLDTVLIGRNGRTVAAVNEAGGVRIDRGEDTRIVKIAATLDHGVIAQTDLVILAVKAYDTREALKEITPFLKSETVVLTLQNGLGNIEAADEILGPGRILAGITSHGANVVAPGHIRHAGTGGTIIGEPGGAISSRAEEVARAVVSAGLECRAAENIAGHIWLKALINAAINPLTALLRVRNGVLAEDAVLSGIMRRVVEEGIKVTRAVAVSLPCDDPYGRVIEVCRATSENISSMLQDVLHGRCTEIDYINGAIAARAARAGIEAPFNALLHALVKALGVSREGGGQALPAQPARMGAVKALALRPGRRSPDLSRPVGTGKGLTPRAVVHFSIFCETFSSPVCLYVCIWGNGLPTKDLCGIIPGVV